MKSFTFFVLIAIVVALIGAEAQDDPAAPPPTGPSMYDTLVEDVEAAEEYIEDMFESPEEQLSDLAEDHYIVSQDCQDLQSQIESAGASASADLLTQYTQCQSDLSEIETKLQQATQQLTSH